MADVELVDTHCHIQSAGKKLGERTTRELWAKKPDLTGDKLVEHAGSAGVNRMVCVGCDLPDNKLAVEFAAHHQACWASIGIHPHEAKDYVNHTEKLRRFTELATAPKVVAIGECGLDYFYEHSPASAQKKILTYQIELALRYQLPMIFHVRKAFEDFWPIFDNYLDIRGVVHSFTDSSENLRRALERGLYVGVNGIATFAKDKGLLETYRAIPLNKLLLETDSPFLTPSPYRGSINEPMQVGTISKFLAELRGESHEELARATTKNARDLFGI